MTNIDTLTKKYETKRHTVSGANRRVARTPMAFARDIGENNAALINKIML